MRLTSLVILIAFFISSCKTTQSLMDFGPKTSNQILEEEKVQDFADDSRPRLDVAIAVFDLLCLYSTGGVSSKYS